MYGSPTNEENAHLDTSLPVTPTVATYSALQRAFDHFNTELFEGSLPECMITLRSGNKHRGYHQANRFVSLDGKTVNELGLNPGFFTLQPIEVVLSTLVHEMVHHWQQCFGHPTSSNHHNSEWGRKMKALGLMPTSTGLPDGDETGRNVTHYIVPDGRYIKACQTLIAQEFKLPWMDRHAPTEPENLEHIRELLKEQGLAPKFSPAPIEVLNGVDEKPPKEQPWVFSPPKKRPSSRVKYQCPSCQAKAWANAEVELICGACEIPMETDQ